MIRLALVAFTVAVAYWPGIFSAASTPRWGAMAVLLPLTCNIWPGKLSAVGWCVLGGIAWAAVTLLFLPIPADGLLDLYHLVLLAFVGLTASRVTSIEPALTFFGWGLAISAALVVPQFFGWSLVFQAAPPAGLFFNREVMAEVAAPMLIWALWSRRWFLSSVLALPVALCQERIAWAVVGLGLFYGWRASWLIKTAAALAFTLCGISALLFMGPDKQGSAFVRAEMWLTAVYSITWLGHGLSWWQLTHGGSIEGFVHSDALQMLVEIGLPSLLFLAIPIVAFKNGALAQRATFAGVCLEALVSFPLHLPAEGFLAALLAGSLVGSRYRVRDAGAARGDGCRAVLRRKDTQPGTMVLGWAGGLRGVPL